MRKAILCAAILFTFPALSTAGFAKGPCNAIKTHREKGFTSFISPASPIVASKWQKKKDTTMYLNFSIDGGSELQNEQDPDLIVNPVKGLIVHFTDGTIWNSDTATIRHHLRNGTSVFSYALKLDDRTIALFSAKKIEKFILSGLTQKEIKTAAQIPQYLNCLKAK